MKLSGNRQMPCGVAVLNLLGKTGEIKIKSFIVVCSIAVAVFVSALAASAQSTNAPARLDYAAFKVVADKNIFNPNRYARGSQPTRNTRSTTPASRVESFTLVGLMTYEKGTFAFFEGTSSGYKKALESGGEIGGHKLSDVTPQSVKLSDGTNHFELRVGTQLRREDDSDWFVNDESDSGSRRRMARGSGSRGRVYDSSTGERSATAATATDGESEPEVIVIESPASAETEQNGAMPAENGNGNGNNGGGEDMSDPVLRRLMERRQQEMNR